jgi:acetyltransferase-like isoleucine patch superfamily enzyme
MNDRTCSPAPMQRTLYERTANRLKLIVLRLAKHLIFSNRLRMWLYHSFLGMEMGRDCIVWAGNRFNDITGFSMGSNVIVGPNNVFLIRGGIEIGNNVNLSGFSFFISQSHDVNDPYGHTLLAKIRIKDDAWVATHAMVMPGVTIGRGAVVAAGAVVVKDVPDYVVVAGNPARQIGTRLPDVRYRLNDTSGMKWL